MFGSLNITLVNVMAKWGIPIVAVYLYAKKVIEQKRKFLDVKSLWKIALFLSIEGC